MSEEAVLRGALPATEFVGREAELAQLEEAARRAVEGHGSLWFVAGQPGMGKTELLKAFVRRAADDPSVEKARFASGSSYETTGPQDVLQPFRGILETLAQGDRHWGKTVLRVMKDIGPDVLELVPGLGSSLVSGGKLALRAGSAMSQSDASHADTAPLLAEQLKRALFEISRRKDPLVLFVEDAQWIDPVSAELIQRLVEPIESQRLLLVVTYRPAEMSTDHPLKATLEALEAGGRFNQVDLDGLAVEEIDEYLVRRFGNSPHPLLADWLHDQSDGHPLFVTQFVSLLTQAGAIWADGERWTVDGELERAADGWTVTGRLGDEALGGAMTRAQRVQGVLRLRIKRLDKEQKRALSIGSVQGHRFWSDVVSSGFEDQEEVLEWLKALERRYELIRTYAGEEKTARHSDIYEFEHVLVQRAFYDDLTKGQRIRFETIVAAAMARLVDADPDPPLQVVLELARHHDRADQPDEAAHRYLDAAESMFAQGTFRESALVARHGVDLIRDRPRDAAGQATFARLVALIADVVEAPAGAGDASAGSGLDQLRNEAREAADAAGDHATIARLEYSRGYEALRAKRLPDSIAAMRTALAHAEKAGDPIAQVMIMSSLGHHLASQNLDQGLAMLRRADELASSGAIKPRTQRETLAVDRQVALLRGHAGIGAFDKGDFGSAERDLRLCVVALRRMKMTPNLPINLAFLAQLLTATGRYEESEQVLDEAIEALEQLPGHRHEGYVRALQVQLYAESGRCQDARRAYHDAWEASDQQAFADVMPLVRNALAEALMCGEPGETDLEEARRQLEASVADSKEFDATRGEITARTLLGRMLRKSGRAPEACEQTKIAVALLEEAGGSVPAVRAEEVYFERARAARDSGDQEEYARMVAKASAVLDRKAASIGEWETMKSFLTRVPLSVSIVQAKAGLGAVPSPRAPRTPAA